MRHEHHADDAEEEQCVIFAALDAHAFDVAVGERDAEQAADEEQRVDKDREAVERDHAVEACHFVADLRDGVAKCDGKTQRGEQSGDAFASLRDEEVEEQ